MSADHSPDATCAACGANMRLVQAEPQPKNPELLTVLYECRSCGRSASHIIGGRTIMAAPHVTPGKAKA